MRDGTDVVRGERPAEPAYQRTEREAETRLAEVVRYAAARERCCFDHDHGVATPEEPCG